jgi:hypothetical protein
VQKEAKWADKYLGGEGGVHKLVTKISKRKNFERLSYHKNPKEGKVNGDPSLFIHFCVA